MALIAAVLSLVPLVGTLGYFGALAMAPVFAWVGAFSGVDAARDPEGGRRSVLDAHRRLTSELAVTWSAAVLVFALASLWNTTCDYPGGLAFFAMGPAVSGWLGGVCGLWAGWLQPRRRRARALSLLPFFVSLVVALHRLYADPVVFAFDPFWGHFTGPIYDEAVGLGRRDVHYRLYNLAWGLAALGGAHFVFDHAGHLRARLLAAPGLALGTALSLAAGVGYASQSTKLRFHSTVASISEVLRGRKETEHFIIHYPPRSLAAMEIEWIAAEHEFAWRRLAAILGDAPAAPVHSFVFDNPDQKRALFGAGNVEVSTPYRGHIYLTYRDFPHPVLHHELAHTFAGVAGDALFGLSRDGVRLNVGLIEGVANALAPRSSDGLDLHDQAAVLDRLDKRPSLEAIMGWGFWSQSASRAYTAAGSFCLWLLETRGAEKLLETYRRAGDFEAIYGATLPALESDWLAFLRERPLAEAEIESQRRRFERRSVFRRPCAHKAAELAGAAERARLAGDDARAIEFLRELCAVESEEPMHQLGLARVLAAEGRIPEAESSLGSAAAAQGLTDADWARIEELRGDLALVAGAYASAAEAYDAALGRALHEGPRRGVQAKRYAARRGLEGSPESARALIEYFGPFDALTPPWLVRLRALAVATQLARLPGDAALGHYLAARQLHAATLIERALEHAELAVRPPAGEPELSSPEFRREARFMLADLRMRAGDFDGARAALEPIETDPDAGAGHRLEVRQWRERIADYEAHAP